MQNPTPHILVVDDDADLLKTMRDILQVKGFEVATARTGAAALTQLAERFFDSALIDLRLGDISGLEILSAIKKSAPDTECILLTGYATQDSAIQAMQLNAFGYHQKPLDMDQVLLSIHRAAEKCQAARALRASEERFRSLVESSPDILYIFSTTRGGLYHSSRVEEVFGYSPEYLRQHPNLWADSIYPEDRPLIAETIREFVEGKFFDIEYRIKDAWGNWHWLRDRAFRRTVNGDEILIEGAATDITRQKQAEENNRTQLVALESAANGIVITDKDGTIEWINPAWSALTGYSKTEAIGQNPRILKSGIHPGEFYKAMWQTITAGEVWRGELVNKRKDRTLYNEEETITPVLDERGEIRHFIAIKHDITARKQTEEKLARANLRLQSLRQIDHALLQSTVEGNSADIEALRHLLTLVPCSRINIVALDEISNSAKFIVRAISKDFSVLHIDQPASLDDLRLNELRENQITSVKLEPEKLNPLEKELYELGGRALVKSPLMMQGNLIGVLALSSEDPDFFTEEHFEIIKDVSAQLALSLHHENLLNEIRRYAAQLEKRVQERTAEIEATRQRLELAVNAGEIGVWESNLKNGVILWDAHMHAIHGTDPEHFVPSVESWWKLILPQDLPKSQKNYEEALTLTGLFSDEHRIIRADGSLRHVSASGIVLYDDERQPERIVGVNIDVTHRKMVEEAMRRANLEMERALRIKDEFLANMSHELRTPLNAIMGISESLLEQTAGSLNEKQSRYVSTVYESGAHLLSLINDILDLSKIEAGRMELTMSDVSVQSLFDSSFRMVKEMAQKKNITIEFQNDPAAPFIYGDARRLLQMLVNLLTNAVKFTPPGGKAGARVSVEAEARQIHLAVWDTGIGIAEADMPRLFQPFTQLDSSLSRSSSGTGLGLMLVMQMARMHGGNISAESKLNEGSCFTLSLPWMPPRADSAVAAKNAREEEAPQPEEKFRAMKILLVEDTESVIMLLVDYLQARGHSLDVARDGASGLALAKSGNPDVILLDVQMPGMDGFEVVKRLRKDEELAAIPVIAMTALAMPGDRERCLAAGMTDYVSKPLRLKNFLRLLESYTPNP